MTSYGHCPETFLIEVAMSVKNYDENTEFKIPEDQWRGLGFVDSFRENVTDEVSCYVYNTRKGRVSQETPWPRGSVIDWYSFGPGFDPGQVQMIISCNICAEIRSER